ncbi:putative lipoprotein [Alloactinosynnema sp. L-07]|uniref:DUF305 domain-containing protein n=1 Tax=Alloactinosynnema sp. L-07 TaxID=1653480 RepID=UPI00065EFE8F|nr:DUF305 domain-containing protein [Alloactinosynnema sp. L-07]CRK58142.1 putative lipoprotein [Alloactinosynnema sp. L-07]
MKSLRHLVVSVLAAVIALGISGCGDDVARPDNPVLQPGKPGEDNKTLSPDEAVSAIPTYKPNEADITYVRDMIVHHRQAVEMTALVPQRGRNEQVKGLASRISDAQQPEIEAMNRWLSTNFQPPVDPGHGHVPADMPGMATPEQLAALKQASGAEFDKLFLQLMIKHHEGAIAMANKAQQSGADVKVQEMADHVVAEQGDEIRRMQTMLAG